MKDKLYELLEDDPSDEEPDEMVEEVYNQDFVTTDTPLTQEPSKKKISRAKQWWKQVTTKKMKPHVSPPTSTGSTFWNFCEINLINSLIP